MKKMILIGLVSCILTGSSFASEFTQYDLAELLINKAVAKNMIENKMYSDEEMITFVREYNIFEFTDSKALVSYKIVSLALSNFENVDIHIEETTVTDEENEDVVSDMIKNVKASKMVLPTNISRIQQLVDQEETIFCRGGSYMEDGVLKVGDYTNFEEAIKKALKIGQVLQPHAEENDLMVAYVGGNGRAMGVEYGENVDKLNRGLDMFYIGYYRDVEWANEEEIDGEVYEFDKIVKIGGGLFANKRLEKAIPVSVERREYRQANIDMDEDILSAFYDGLRVMDPSRAEAIFKKMTSDYIYSKTHQYGDPNNSRTEFFKIDGQLIYREDVRSADGRHRYITYRFVK